MAENIPEPFNYFFPLIRLMKTYLPDTAGDFTSGISTNIRRKNKIFKSSRLSDQIYNKEVPKDFPEDGLHTKIQENPLPD